MKKIILYTVTILCLQVYGQNKSALDLYDMSMTKGKTGPGKVSAYNSNQVSNNQISATLIEGGFFTLGTTNGKSPSALDDNCPLTYGHPYAMTSYPLFSIDSIWYTPDSFFPGLSSNIIHAINDTLILTTEIKNKISIVFSISIEGDSYVLSVQSTNLDTIPHHFGLGLVYDPTLGSGGDGSLFIADQNITHETIFESTVSSFSIHERAEGAKGLGLTFRFNEQPHLIAANWPQIYRTPSPVLLSATNYEFYDLALKLYWPETIIAAGQSRQVSFKISLLDPDFSSTVFTRWDLPSYFSIEDNIMFPREFSTVMEMSSTQNTLIAGSYLKLDLPTSIYSYQDSIDLQVPAASPKYQKINLQSKLVYEDKVVDITIHIIQGGQVLDAMTRHIFMPATPVSDTGLEVNIDSVITSNYPQMQFILNVKNEENGHYIYNLEKENIYLFENNNRVTDFSFGKDTTGGLEQADIVFVLDVTGSMSGEINNVKNNIIEFADSLAIKGIDYQLGLVTFLDVIENIYPFTNDVHVFHQHIADQYAHGGGDGPENSLDALDAAADFNFRDNAKRIIIWITDADYHEQDQVTDKSKIEVRNKLLANGIVVHAIGNTIYKSEFYDPIIMSNGGNFYDINGNFRDILLDISRLNTTNNYLISYYSESLENENIVKVEIRYAGLGGNTTFNYSTPALIQNSFLIDFKCYPNPFNPTIHFSIGATDFDHGSLTIFNVLGQVVKKFNMDGNTSKITWQAANDYQNKVSTGLYYVSLKLVDYKGKTHYKNSKILFLK